MKKGTKHDLGKDRWDLLPWICIREVVRVLTFGARKYADDNWQHVDEAYTRYFSAAHRHIYEWECGRDKDAESGLPHLAHAICCLLFLLWFDLVAPALDQKHNNGVQDGDSSDQ